MRPFKTFLVSLSFATLLAAPSIAATCGNSSGGFNAWKAAFAGEAQAAGVGQRGLAALASAQYAWRSPHGLGPLDPFVTSTLSKIAPAWSYARLVSIPNE